MPRLNSRQTDCLAYKTCDLEYAIKDNNAFIPYMSLGVALTIMYDDVTASKEGNKIVYTCPYDIAFTVDCKDNTITVHNFDNIIASYGSDKNIYHMTEGEDVNTHIKENYVTYQGTEDVVFNLNKYNLDIYEYNDDFYLPFSVINTVSINMCYWASCNFNGTAFYLLDFSLGAVSLNYVGTTFEKNFHNGDYRLRNARNNRDFREYNYNCLMFHLDYSFGFRDDRIPDFNDFLTKNHQDIVNNLKSDNETFYCQAVEKLINYAVGDGHSSAGNNASACGASSFQRTGILSKRYESLWTNEEDLLARRGKALGQKTPALRYYRDTAIITFDQFLYYPYQMSDNVAEALVDYDSFALVYSCMKLIKLKGDEIKNIYFDLTCNPGGSVISAIGILGYMTENVELTTYCALTKTVASQSYKVDTNLNGKFDDDCLAKKYKFFVLTSAMSFSCATWFPHLAKENGCATVVGENTAGGACNSYITATPDGKIFRISGIAPRASFKNNPGAHPDNGVIVDYPMERDYFYNDDYLNTFANSIQ